MNEDTTQAMPDIYAPVKRLLGLPEGNPVEYSYPVTDWVIAQAVNPHCRLYLETLASDGPIYTWQLSQVLDEIKSDYPDDSKLVIQQLLAGQCQEHLSALSLNGIGHKLRITTVNPAGIKLSMAALRFEVMVRENGTTKLLGHLNERDPETGGAVVTLSTPISKARVVGWYNGETSTLHVSCLRDKDGGVDFTTTFALDSNMVVSHYEVLRRLHEDRERFQKLLDASDSFLEVDPFRQLKREKEQTYGNNH
ncbi:hypothetical protein KP003_02980 [Geomonas nitrogeniifigens]|uniref:hypothetical protein n=1 Tax=Geomonas diazotrophica TaxID=2843197 RepID=UPI001C2B7DB3|nr:hypothetical protein [Geomonas nitrogeniifigens]QXE87389.1 hypothetical protein KP003_02980 [Geomonas nitrogeniifigens]